MALCPSFGASAQVAPDTNTKILNGAEETINWKEQFENIAQEYNEHLRSCPAHIKSPHQLEVQEESSESKYPMKEIEKLKIEIGRLSALLSKQMHQKLSEDESSLENINSRNRPSKIVEDYNETMTTVWLDAKDDLDQANPGDNQEEAKVKFLADILMYSYDIAMDELRMVRSNLQQSLLDPIGRFRTHTQTTGSLSGQHERLDDFDESKLGSDLRASLINYLKEASGRINTHMLIKMVWQSFGSSPLLSNLTKTTTLETYMSSALRLAWRMAVQKPPLVFITPDMNQPVCKDRHEIYFSCPKHPDNVISSYVYPIIAQKGHYLTKGKVFVVRRSELKSARPDQSLVHPTVH